MCSEHVLWTLKKYSICTRNLYTSLRFRADHTEDVVFHGIYVTDVHTCRNVHWGRHKPVFCWSHLPIASLITLRRGLCLRGYIVAELLVTTVKSPTIGCNMEMCFTIVCTTGSLLPNRVTPQITSHNMVHHIHALLAHIIKVSKSVSTWHAICV